MIILLIFIFQIYGRILQYKGVLQKKGEKWNQSDEALDKILDHISRNLTQNQKGDLELIEGYIFSEGLQYYAQANQDEKQKMFLTLIGIIGEIEEGNEQETKRLEKNIQYFSQLNTTDKDIVMTKISQSLDKSLKDSSKEFNSKVVLWTIKNEIENFESKPERGGSTTWNINEYQRIQEKSEQELKEIEYQIQEFLDQGFSEQKIREKMTEFIDYFFGNSTILEKNNKNIDEIIQDVKKQEEEESNQNQQLKQQRQKVREIIREKLEQGKKEEEIEKEVEDYLSENGVKDLSEEEKNLIKLMIQKEIVRNQRQQSVINDDKTNSKAQNNVYYIYLGIFTIVLLIFLVVFIIRRDKIINNQRKQMGFKIQDNTQDIEQMD